MSKKILGAVSICTLLISGCASTIPMPSPRDVEPALVGKPVNERISETENDINNQLVLLNKVSSGKKVGSYNVVTHNNNLDARVGSSMTIPKAYANTKQNSGVADTTVAVANPLLNQKVKKIEWDNNSLNKLSENIAKAIGYSVVIKEGRETRIRDRNISFLAADQTLGQVIEKLKREAAPVAEIVVVDQNKTFNIFYK